MQKARRFLLSHRRGHTSAVPLPGENSPNDFAHCAHEPERGCVQGDRAPAAACSSVPSRCPESFRGSATQPIAQTNSERPPRVAHYSTRCAPGRRAVRPPRTATGPSVAALALHPVHPVHPVPRLVPSIWFALTLALTCVLSRRGWFLPDDPHPACGHLLQFPRAKDFGERKSRLDDAGFADDCPANPAAGCSRRRRTGSCCRPLT